MCVLIISVFMFYCSEYECSSAVVRKMHYLSMSLNKVTNVICSITLFFNSQFKWSPYERFRFLNISVSLVIANRRIVLIMTTMTL